MASPVLRCTMRAPSYGSYNYVTHLIKNRNTTPQEFDAERAKKPDYQLYHGNCLGFTALAIAAISGNVPLIQHIIEVGGKGLLNIGSRSGQTPLSLAVQYDQYDAAKKLIELGSNVNRSCDRQDIRFAPIHTPEGATPLWLALATHNIAMVKLLIINRARIEPKPDQEGIQMIQQALKEISTSKQSLISTVDDVSIALPYVLVEMIADFVPLEDINTEKEIRERLVTEIIHTSSINPLIYDDLLPAATPCKVAKLIADYLPEEETSK